MSSSETLAGSPAPGRPGPMDQATSFVRYWVRSWTPRRAANSLLVWAGRAGFFALIIWIMYRMVNLQWLPIVEITNRLFVASPREVGAWLVGAIDDGEVWSDLAITLSEAVYGWLIGATAGVIVGLTLARVRYLNRVFQPYLIFANAIPKVVLAPMFILWFGLGLASKIVLVIAIVFFLVQVPTQTAVKLLDPDLDTVAQAMGATGLQRFFKVVLPGVTPAVLGAVRLGAVWALLGASFGEILGTNAGGLGERYISAHNGFAMDQSWGTSVILALLAIALNVVVGGAERWLLRWQAAGRATSVVSL